MKAEELPTHFAGFDWAKAHHDILVIDSLGNIVIEFQFEHAAEGWKSCQEKLAAFPRLAVAIEAGHANAIERLMLMGHRVYAVHPRSSKSYRARKRPSGVKTDRVDCLALAEALRFEGQSWTPVAPPEPLVLRLRLLCRDEVALIEQRTALVNQLIQALYEYYPAALEAFDDWTSPAAWAFVEKFPTPEVLVKAGKRKWQNFLHARRLYRPETYEKRLDAFTHAQEFCGSEAVTTAKSTLALALVKLLQTLEKQLLEFRHKIIACFHQHPDHAIFVSLPGAGEKLAPRLLAELFSLPGGATEAPRLQVQAGMAPVSYQSGQVSVVYLRRQCNKFLQHTVHLWADLTRHYSDWARIYYEAHRKKGQSHACAVRCLAMRWLKILSAMMRSHTSYDAALHSRNQLRHGSWVLELVPKATDKPA